MPGFQLEHPEEARLLYNAVREDSNGPLRDVVKRLRLMTREFLGEMVATAVERREVRRNMDTGIAVFFLESLITLMEEYVEERYGFSYDRIYSGDGNEHPPGDEELESLIGQFMDILECGLGEKVS